MENRETRTINTPSGKVLVLKTYLTARERNAFRAIFIKNAEYNVDQATAAMSVTKIAGEATEEAERKIIEIAVVSYDGKTEGLADMLLDGLPAEYDFVSSEAMKTLQPGKAPAK